jgi:hypothetical protein
LGRAEKATKSSARPILFILPTFLPLVSPPAPGLCSLVHHLIMVPAVSPQVRGLDFAS